MNKIWNLQQYGEHPALLDESGRELSYQTLSKETETIYQHMNGRCLVFCLCRNAIGSVLGYVACINHGAIPLLLNSHMEEELLKNLNEQEKELFDKVKTCYDEMIQITECQTFIKGFKLGARFFMECFENDTDIFEE